MNKKVFLIISISIFVFLAFSVIVIAIFNSVSNNPIDKIAIPYIRENSEIDTNYGSIVTIGRNILYKKQELEHSKKIPYTVQTEKCRITVYVILEKNSEAWEAVSYEVIEVICDGD